MPVPIACPVSLTPEEHARLESLGRAHSTPHAFAFRCRLILRTAALAQRRLPPLSRSSIWCILEEADLKPHRSVYWLNSHDPDFEAKAASYLSALSACAALLPRGPPRDLRG